MTRRALIPHRSTTPHQVAAYLPAAYAVEASTDEHIVIAGQDSAGWTLDDYVIPRLASGLIFATECERIPVRLPFSEVCCHMGIAGRDAEVELLPDHMAQVFVDGKPFSFPITYGEAGVRSLEGRS